MYASLNGYRWDDFTAYLYASDDYGQHWTRIGLDLPAEPLNVVREDPVNPDLLYVGTDHGLYISLDRGQHFQALGKDFPAVAVHDLAIQATENDLIVGTHGRSMYKISVARIQQLNSEVLDSTIFLFDLPATTFSKNWGKKRPWQELKNPELPVEFYCKNDGKVNWQVRTKDGLVLNYGTTDCV